MALEEARAAYLHGAEEHSRATLGGPLTQDELERVLARFRYDDDYFWRDGGRWIDEQRSKRGPRRYAWKL